MRKLLSVLALSLSLAGTGVAGIYKWVDEDGKIHFGDSPPAEQGAEAVKTAPGPNAEDVQRSREKLDSLLKQQKSSASKRAREEKEQRKEQQASKREKEIRGQRCLTAQKNLQNLRWADGVYRVDEKGDRRFLGNKSRTEEIERARKQVEQYCD